MYHQCASAGRRQAFRASLSNGHVLATLMDEHDRILEHLKSLEELAGSLGDAPTRAVLEQIESIGRALVGAEPHHEREEKALFPALVERGLHGPPACMEAEHVELRALKRGVEQLARRGLDGTDTHGALRATSLELVRKLRDHIAKEDDILYPMAVETITDPAVWAELRRRCDEIGYCCDHSET